MTLRDKAVEEGLLVVFETYGIPLSPKEGDTFARAYLAAMAAAGNPHATALLAEINAAPSPEEAP